MIFPNKDIDGPWKKSVLLFPVTFKNRTYLVNIETSPFQKQNHLLIKGEWDKSLQRLLFPTRALDIMEGLQRPILDL